METLEKNVTQEVKQETDGVAGKKDKMENLRKKYKEMDGKIYEIETSIQEDDENETVFDFIFRKPGTPSYDRYVKTSGTSGTKALKTFVLDNICDEQRDELKSTLEEYPAMAISLGEKLLNMLGLSKDTTVKKL
ncbi:MAG: hypothetical protein NC412_09745 [Roseburia sp.]|nr:hypothetical protein [Roseburia sp.]